VRFCDRAHIRQKEFVFVSRPCELAVLIAVYAGGRANPQRSMAVFKKRNDRRCTLAEISFGLKTVAILEKQPSAPRADKQVAPVGSKDRPHKEIQ